MKKDDHLIETSVDSQLVFDGGLLRVFKDSVRLPDGKKGFREYIKHPGAVVILPSLENGKLIFVRQYRYPVSQVILELPAGKIDTAEDPFDTAKRELLEETGHGSENWRNIGLMHPGVGYSDEKIIIYLARDTYRISAPQLDEGEFLDILELSPEESFQAVRQGMITDSKTITALFWLQNILLNKW